MLLFLYRLPVISPENIPDVGKRIPTGTFPLFFDKSQDIYPGNVPHVRSASLRLCCKRPLWKNQ